MVMSDGIPLLLALARMESQEIAGLSVAMLQRILSYDTRYKRVVLSVTKDPELIRLIEEGAAAGTHMEWTVPGLLLHDSKRRFSINRMVPGAHAFFQLFAKAAGIPTCCRSCQCVFG